MPNFSRWPIILLAAHALMTGPAQAAEAPLPVPAARVIDPSVPAARRDAMLLAARRYYAFWNTGNADYARDALAPGFQDRTLPAGRVQGVQGPLQASAFFRKAVPDLQLKVDEVLLVGDRVVGRLHFTGHFSGTFGSGKQARQGDGRPIDFIATDIYRIRDGRITDNWHLEDNLTLMQQLGVVAGEGA